MGGHDHACDTHDHEHVHGDGCGHEAVEHNGHIDYVVDGHLHHVHGDHCDDHGPAPGHDHSCEGHDKGHVHGDGCGHEAVEHDGHVDYVVDGHLHHQHGDHCHHHGPVAQG